jgi:hypothetical protein
MVARWVCQLADVSPGERAPRKAPLHAPMRSHGEGCSWRLFSERYITQCETWTRPLPFALFSHGTTTIDCHPCIRRRRDVRLLGLCRC